MLTNYHYQQALIWPIENTSPVWSIKGWGGPFSGMHGAKFAFFVRSSQCPVGVTVKYLSGSNSIPDMLVIGWGGGPVGVGQWGIGLAP